MNKKTTGILAGAAGAALLIGGGTFALWNDGESVPGGTITTGNLDVAPVGSWTWVDLSEDRTDAGHTIPSIATHRIVPGDVIEGTVEFSAALEGDNIVAELGGEFGAVSSVPEVTDPALLALLSTDLELQYYDAVAADWVPIADGFVTSQDNPEAGSLPQLPPTVSGTANVRAVLTVEFSDTATDRQLAQLAVTFGESSLELTQVRTLPAGTDGGF